MRNRRYPFVAAGRLAAVAFAINGGIVGIVLTRIVPNAPAATVNAILWAILTGGIAFLVFATDAQQRPPSIRQASAADGVVTGLVTGSLGTLLELIAASGAGSSGTGGPGTLQAIETVLATTALGAVDGGLLGLVLVVAGGGTLLATRHAVSASQKAGTRSSKSRQKARRRR